MGQYIVTNEPLPIDFEGCITDVQRTLQNVKNLIMCRMGEIPYDRLRGFDPALFDLPPDEFEEALLPELDRVLMWEPDANVISASYSFNDDGEVRIECVVDVNEESGEEE